MDLLGVEPDVAEFILNDYIPEVSSSVISILVGIQSDFYRRRRHRSISELFVHLQKPLCWVRLG